jgi:6,7-dimethyl-8-ribityllumazine synthase
LFPAAALRLAPAADNLKTPVGSRERAALQQSDRLGCSHRLDRPGKSDRERFFVLQPPAIRFPVGAFIMSQHAPSASGTGGAAFTVGVAAARFNPRFVDALLRQVRDHLLAAGVSERRIVLVRVPGSNELPSGVQLLCRRHRPDVCIALGVIIRGETLHYELVAGAASQGLTQVALAVRIPVINGVIVAENERQAAARCGGPIRKGEEFVQAALEMAALQRKLSR